MKEEKSSGKNKKNIKNEIVDNKDSKNDNANNEDLTPEEKRKIAILELGSDYTATVKIGEKFIFEIHAPTVEEDLKIQIQSGNMLSTQIKQDVDLKFVTNIISTLDIVTDKIYTLEKDKNSGLTKKILISEGSGCFWAWVKTRRDVSDFYKIVILPLFMEYIEFKETLETDLEELKNYYAQD